MTVSRRSRRWVFLILFLVAAAVAYAVTVSPSGPRSLRRFDPPRLANLELRMWQAYYAKENVRLFGLLVVMLREQYRYSWATATREAYHLARAAASFGSATGNYDVVLPDLEAAYTTARDWLHASFDPTAVARAELAWWVARRMPGQNSPDHVGALIATEYGLLYDMPPAAVLEAGTLRAEAAALRDSQQGDPDWVTIERLLLESYRELAAAVNTGFAALRPGRVTRADVLTASP
jgi:hypothetical protein